MGGRKELLAYFYPLRVVSRKGKIDSYSRGWTQYVVHTRLATYPASLLAGITTRATATAAAAAAAAAAVAAAAAAAAAIANYFQSGQSGA